MKFYDCSTAPSPRRVRVFIAEKGLGIPTVQVDLRGGEHLSPEFRAINPRCTVPVLELDDGTRLLDSNSICLYLEATRIPTSPAFSSPTKARSLRRWWPRCSGNVPGRSNLS